MFQVVLRMQRGRKVHVIQEFENQEKALDYFERLVRQNKGSRDTPKGSYAVRKKPDEPT
ncbi:hypothetical protein Pse7367_2390 [Thalassoporum mexicanum PCC 7367]|uniref:hypothetical protein n=1 Tax=Thalassoporum mexicanum TaxID=3457544 RepID=UPI00029FBC45|nr:hypothetical protein [Pseudanabaena sp. PCC 7367]AFY70651.1 hypothetical protein Pse7367_2390 [Pseudanabaena sp. PCC 7367]